MHSISTAEVDERTDEPTAGQGASEDGQLGTENAELPKVETGRHRDGRSRPSETHGPGEPWWKSHKSPREDPGPFMTEDDGAADPPRRQVAPEGDPAETRQLTGPDATLLEPDGTPRSTLRRSKRDGGTGRGTANETEAGRRDQGPQNDAKRGCKAALRTDRQHPSAVETRPSTPLDALLGAEERAVVTAEARYMTHPPRYPKARPP